jgi:hypothetical protein
MTGCAGLCRVGKTPKLHSFGGDLLGLGFLSYHSFFVLCSINKNKEDFNKYRDI